MTAGYDGHLIFPGTTMYGRNDTWPNYQSQMKGNGVKGIVFDAWNGYTEGWTGMESCGGMNDNKACSASLGNKDMYNWISNTFSFDPRNCDSLPVRRRLAGLPCVWCDLHALVSAERIHGRARRRAQQ